MVPLDDLDSTQGSAKEDVVSEIIKDEQMNATITDLLSSSDSEGIPRKKENLMKNPDRTVHSLREFSFPSCGEKIKCC